MAQFLLVGDRPPYMDPPLDRAPRRITLPGTGGPYVLENCGGNYVLSYDGKGLGIGCDLRPGLKGLGLSKDLAQRLLEEGLKLKDGQKLVVTLKRQSS